MKNRQLNIILPVIYGFCAFLFFWKYFPYHLHFHEQFQLFLFTKTYFFETFSRPGGFCNYAGRFFTQFYLSSFFGALLVTCFLTGIQQLVFAITRRFQKHSAALFLSFLPSLFYWYLFCDVNSQTGGLIALLLTLTTALMGTLPKSSSARCIYLFASIPILYWLAGGAVILNVVLLLMYEWFRCRDDARNISAKLTNRISTVFAAIGFTLAMPFLAKLFLKQHILSRYWWGVDYIHFTTYSPYLMIFLWILVLLVVTGVLFLPEMKKLRTLIAGLVQMIAVLIVVYIVIFKIAYPQNLAQEEIMMYDYHSRMKNWNKIIEAANRKSPTIPMSVSILNLALYKTGQLPERMFEYFQNGPEGLLPTFQRDFMIPIVSGEPYYYLGFVNTAQRFAFEAMEAFPDFQKSARSVKRLAETNLINGNYEATSKYLYLLERTVFYKKWAKETRKYLYDDAKIEAHPEWGEIRRFQTDRDFLFSSEERNVMLGIFFQQNTDNRMAYEYLMAYTLLSKDIQIFPVFFQLQKGFTYREIPRSWQEAMVYIWGLTNKVTDHIPLPVSNSVKKDVVAYANIYTTMPSPEPMLRKQFSKTFWYYLHFQDYQKTDAENHTQY